MLLITGMVFLSLGCEALLEQTSPLEGTFFIEDGWIAFETQNFDTADKHFSTAISQNETDSLILFQSHVGLGWTKLYKGREVLETDAQGFIHYSGIQFKIAQSIMSAMEGNMMYDTIPEFILNKIDLNAGLSYQNAYMARLLSLNGTLWESANSTLSDSINQMIFESISYSENLAEDFIFRHDSSLVFHDIVLLRVENYILLGDLTSATTHYNEMDKTTFSFEISEECSVPITEEKIIECTCILINHGDCPFGN
ncbi:MAG: hypothetical protein QF472_07805 [Candidatus Marinimicrobia bacterium]|nr:hypothetical protein [Candidatus Neomarinimicrobiota bacterium]